MLHIIQSAPESTAVTGGGTAVGKEICTVNRSGNLIVLSGLDVEIEEEIVGFAAVVEHSVKNISLTGSIVRTDTIRFARSPLLFSNIHNSGGNTVLADFQCVNSSAV